MKKQTYYPSRIGDQVVWLNNLKTKIAVHAAATLTLDSAELAAFILDIEAAIYALDAYRGAVDAFDNAAYARIDEALSGDGPGNITWLGFTPPAPTPAAVPYGCLSRVFAYINGTVRKNANYDEAIGLDLGTEPPAPVAPDPLAVPEFTLRTGPGGKLEVVWTKGGYDGVRLQFDLGAAGTQTDTDMRPNYVLNWLPATGQSAIIRVRLMFILKGEDTGTWSPWQQWTLTGS